MTAVSTGHLALVKKYHRVTPVDFAICAPAVADGYAREAGNTHPTTLCKVFAINI